MSGAPVRRVDAFLDGRVQAVQLAGHHHAGLEAMLLSAAVDADFAGTVVDLGSGVGVAGFAVAARVPRADVVLVDRDAEALTAAKESLLHPANAAFAARVKLIAADIAAPESERMAAGLAREFADIVVTNPPFRHAASGTKSPVAAVRGAHVLGTGGVDDWVRAAASILQPGGRLVVIFRADGLNELTAALAGRFGGVTILPIHPRVKLSARLVLVAADKGSHAPQRILPGLALHDEVGSTYLHPVERLLRHGASLAEVHPPWATSD